MRERSLRPPLGYASDRVAFVVEAAAALRMMRIGSSTGAMMSGSSSAVAGADAGAAALVAAASAGDCREDNAAAGLSPVSVWCGAEPSSTTEVGPAAAAARESATSGEVGPRDRGRDRDVMAGDAATEADAEEPRECGSEDACS